MTRTTSKLLDALRQSWLFKLVWRLAPLAFLALLAVSANTSYVPRGVAGGLLHLLPLIFLAAAWIAGCARWPAQRARNRALSPLQRLQMSDGPSPQPLAEFLETSRHPPVETLPAWLQSMIANWGRPVSPRLMAAGELLFLIAIVLMGVLAVNSEAVSWLSQRLGDLTPSRFWGAFIALALLTAALGQWLSLRQMHDHYVKAAGQAGRRPFPAVR